MGHDVSPGDKEERGENFPGQENSMIEGQEVTRHHHQSAQFIDRHGGRKGSLEGKQKTDEVCSSKPWLP